MRTAGHGDDTLPSLPLTGVVKDRHALRRLHKLKEEAGVAAKIRQGGSHAPFPEAAILGTVGPIDCAASTAACASPGDRDVERRRLLSSGRRRPVLSSFAAREFVLAQVCCLKKGELKFPHYRPLLLNLRRERRNSPVRRIDDERRPAAHGLVCCEDRRVIGAADILLGSATAAALVSLSTNGGRSLLIEFGSFLVGKEFPIGVPSWPLQRYLAVARPDALQVRFAPRRAGHLRGFAGPQLRPR